MSAAGFDFAFVTSSSDDGLAPLRLAIAAAHRADEGACVRGLIERARLAPAQLARAQALATTLAEAVRAERSKAGGVDALMLEFSLDSREGIALMCLAEALLRIPDAATRDRLIRDKISKGDWSTHVGASPSLFVNAAAWGLLVTGRIVEMRSEGTLEAALTSLMRKGGEPLIRKGVDLAMRLLGRQFVTGRTIDEALTNAREREARGYRYSFDMLGEAAMTDADAQRYFSAYEAAIHAIGGAAKGRGVVAGPGISVKLSALHPRYARAQRDRVRDELQPRAAALAKLARDYDIGFNIDAEEADRLELSLDVLAALAEDAALADWEGLGFVVQAYQKRAPGVIEWLAALARRHRRRLMVRLVKGAYWDTEIKRAQVDGVDGYPVYTRKVHTDVSYLVCAKAMLAAPDAIYPQFASHNAFTIAAVHTLAGDASYEFQCLHGMGESVYDQVVGSDRLDRACRIYAPVGSHETLLAYLVRRLLENGANSSFVNRIVDPAFSIASLVTDPVADAEKTGRSSHPAIPLPSEIFRDRRNSRGADLADDTELAALALAMDALSSEPREAVPLLGDAPDLSSRATAAVRNPANRDDVIGTVTEATVDDVARAVGMAVADGRSWSRMPAPERALCLERAADLMEAERPLFVALAVREAGKSVANAISEVREAVDFLRYYASGSRVDLSRPGVEAVGPIVAISPWNFPLAIFVGEVAAALAAGNPVLAKPAEQTPLIACEAVRLLHRAGVPRAALQFLPGRGETVGAALVADRRIAGVVFTGSTEVARLIDRELGRRDDDPVLIAETGGQNAMIVDSSALPEQVVADALASAFDSAGQRCSALRILCLQDDVAQQMLAMLEGAMRELATGDPRRLATDVGPVIDADAARALTAHVAEMRTAGLRVVAMPLPPECERGTFVAPTLVDLGGVAGLRHLRREVFGPVLHVLRWKRDQLSSLVDAINATGYALTHGIHSRIDETVAAILARVRAGNVYVNRTIVGAVVGVQPFGGHRRSGTGPKAGGPLYLRRLVRGALPWAPLRASSAPVRDETAPPSDTPSQRRDETAALTDTLPQRRDEPPPPSETPAPLRDACSPLSDPPFSLSTSPIALPGPTGESNTLEFLPRGVVLCIADNFDALKAQAEMALALGNSVLLPRDAASLRVGDTLRGASIRVSDVIDPDAIDAVLMDAAPDRARRVRAELAASSVAIVPVIVPAADGRYDRMRLVVERTVTVNTAAAGGNAALLSLSEEGA